jgi:hypothetical protein
MVTAKELQTLYVCVSSDGSWMEGGQENSCVTVKPVYLMYEDDGWESWRLHKTCGQ